MRLSLVAASLLGGAVYGLQLLAAQIPQTISGIPRELLLALIFLIVAWALLEFLVEGPLRRLYTALNSRSDGLLNTPLWFASLGRLQGALNQKLQETEQDAPSLSELNRQAEQRLLALAEGGELPEDLLSSLVLKEAFEKAQRVLSQRRHLERQSFIAVQDQLHCLLAEKSGLDREFSELREGLDRLHTALGQDRLQVGEREAALKSEVESWQLQLGQWKSAQRSLKSQLQGISRQAQQWSSMGEQTRTLMSTSASLAVAVNLLARARSESPEVFENLGSRQVDVIIGEARSDLSQLDQTLDRLGRHLHGAAGALQEQVQQLEKQKLPQEAPSEALEGQARALCGGVEALGLGLSRTATAMKGCQEKLLALENGLFELQRLEPRLIAALQGGNSPESPVERSQDPALWQQMAVRCDAAAARLDQWVSQMDQLRQTLRS